MSSFDHLYSETDKKLKYNVLNFINTRNYNEAIAIIENKIKDFRVQDSVGDKYLMIELAAFLIDIGTEGFNQEALTKGLNFITKFRKEIEKLVHPSSVEYNLGNVKRGMFDIKRSQKDFKYTISNMEDLFQAKQK